MTPSQRTPSTGDSQVYRIGTDCSFAECRNSHLSARLSMRRPALHHRRALRRKAVAEHRLQSRRTLVTDVRERDREAVVEHMVQVDHRRGRGVDMRRVPVRIGELETGRHHTTRSKRGATRRRRTLN